MDAEIATFYLKKVKFAMTEEYVILDIANHYENLNPIQVGETTASFSRTRESVTLKF